MDGFQRVEAFFYRVHVGGAPGTQVQHGTGVFGYYVGAGAAFDDVGVDADAAAQIVPFFDANDLGGEFVNGVDAFLWGQAGVGGAAINGELGFAHTFTRGFQ